MKIIFTTNKDYTDAERLLLHLNSDFSSEDVQIIIDNKLEIVEEESRFIELLKNQAGKGRDYSDKELKLIASHYSSFYQFHGLKVVILSPSIVDTDIVVYSMNKNEFKGTFNPYSPIKIHFDRKKSRYILPNFKPAYKGKDKVLKQVERLINNQ